MRASPELPSLRTYLAQIALAFTVGVLCLTAVVVAIIVLYVIKSKLGINLLPGPSPLHGVFVSMRNAGLV